MMVTMSSVKISQQCMSFNLHGITADNLIWLETVKNPQETFLSCTAQSKRNSSLILHHKRNT